MNKIVIFFVIPNLKAGGAQRIMSYLAQNINSSLFLVKLIIVGVKNSDDFTVKDIDVLYLNKTRVLTAIPTLFRLFFQEKPSIVFGSIGHVNMLLGFFAFIFRKIKFVGRESSVFSERIKYSSPKSNFFFFLMKFLYSKLTGIICQSNDMRDDLIKSFNLSPLKLFTINNPITELKIFDKKVFNSDKVKFITIGRLSKEKGILRVLKSLSKLNKYNFEYTLIGSGSMHDEIIKEVDKLNLKNNFIYVPHSNNVLEYLSNHDYFLQGSYVEGFPNTLLESCSVGTPFIAYNAPGGTKEIFQSGVNGYLVNSDEEFTYALSDIKNLKKLNRSHVMSSVVDKFSEKRILGEYENYFLSI